MNTDVNQQYKERWEMFADRVDTPQPCEKGDTAEVSQLSGVPEWMADYPVTGEVVRVEPYGIGTHNVFADWFIRIQFDEEEETGVYDTTTELFCVGGARRDWDELPVEIVAHE
jgi:hypothetical protein